METRVKYLEALTKIQQQQIAILTSAVETINEVLRTHNQAIYSLNTRGN